MAQYSDQAQATMDKFLAVSNSPEILEVVHMPRCDHSRHMFAIVRRVIRGGSIQCCVQCMDCYKTGRALPQKQLANYMDIDSLPNHREMVFSP